MYRMYKDERLAGASFWYWSETKDYGRGGHACVDGILKEALVDINGNPTAAQLTIADNAIIEGSADGTTPKVSTLRFELDLGADGRVANIAEVDAIAFELMATSAAINNAVPLNTNQIIGVKLQLELAGGITVDIDEFISEE